jgi:pyruvate dehydrogenase E2 component (dihydrolipoamide acetyltransferase)
MGEFRMPSLGADMDEGTLVEWLVAPGDTVHRGDIVAVVDTAKSAIDIEVFEDAVVDELLVPVGTTVPVGTPLARLRETDGDTVTSEATSAEPAASQAPAPPPVTSPIVRHLAHEGGVDLSKLAGSGAEGQITRDDVLAAGSSGPAAPSVAGDRLRASPYARRKASELGIDLADVTGTGPGGAITVADLGENLGRSSAPGAPTSPAEATPSRQRARDKQAAMREAIGQLMARSKREIPHYYLTQNIDMRTAMEWIRDVNSARGVSERLVPAVLLLKAVANAVHTVPEVNGLYVDGSFQPAEHVHLGVAVSLRGGGLVAPAIHEVENLDLDELMAALKDVVARARAGRLRGSEMSDPTITVTNLGDQGVESVVGVIYPPQVALVGFGRIVQRPWAVDDMLAVHPVVTASLAADHRVTDGHRGGLFLAAVDDALQRPEEL